MALVSQLEEWIKEFAKTYCHNCSDSCCNGTRQLINVSPREAEVFIEHGLRKYLFDDLDCDSVLEWFRDGTLRGMFNKTNNYVGEVLSKDKVPIPKPAVILIPLLGVDMNGLLYSMGGFQFVLLTKNYCPFYTKEKTCSIYEDVRRPLVCREYPLEYDEEAENVSEVIFRRTCPYSREGINDLRNKSSGLEIEVK